MIATLDGVPVDAGSIARAASLVRARRNAAPETFRSFVARVSPKYRWFRHCDALAGVIDRVVSGDLRRLMVFMPPRHSKSETFSRLLPAYYLSRYPEKWVGLASYAADLAYGFSRDARNLYRTGGLPLSSEAAGVQHWETGRGGGMWATGVGGPATGKGFSLGIIDDPIKNAEEALSDVIRRKQIDWYRSVFYTRCEPDAAIVLIMTRWHEDDLAGMALEDEAGELPERWHIVRMPALAEAETVGTAEERKVPPTCSLEDDFREFGEALCPERYDEEKLKAIRQRLGPYYWSALYQQRPRPKEGGMFKWDWFSVVDAQPADVVCRVRYWDTAGTEDGGDYTSGARVSVDRSGLFWIEEVTRGRWSPARRDQEILAAAQRDRAVSNVTVKIRLEQEAGVGGKARTQALIRLLAGFTVDTEPATGSKVTRAEPFASQAEAGNVRLVRGDWNRDFLNELCDFPNGKHDDQVDSASGAFNFAAQLARTGTLNLSPFRM